MAGEFMGGLLGGGVGSVIGGSVVRLFLDTSSMDKGLATAEAKNRSASGKMASGWSKFGLIASAAAVTAGIALVKFAAVAVKAASAEGEAFNKVNRVFEDSVGIITKFAETSAEKFGISKQAAFDAAGGFGAMFETAGLANDEAAKMSVTMLALASDMGSFSDVDPSVMLDKLRSGLAGQSRPLRVFGVYLSDAAVKAEAYGSGIAKVGVELTDAQKIQARYSLILKQTTKQQGDFGRTLGESLPNQMRSLSAQIDDMEAEVGKKLLPTMLDLLKAANDLIPVLAPVLVGIFQALADAAQGIVAPLTIVKEGMGGVKDAATFLLRAVSPIFNVWKMFHHDTPEVAEDLNKVGAAAEATGDDISNFAGKTSSEMASWKASLKSDFNVAGDVFSDLADKANLTADQIIQSFMRQIKAQNDYAANWQALNARNLPDELREQLAALGMDGANIVAALADANGKQFSRIISQWGETETKADQITRAITGIGSALNRIPALKVIDMELNVRANVSSGTGTQLSNAQIQHLIDQAVRTP